jgi:hypothetical protein
MGRSFLLLAAMALGASGAFGIAQSMAGAFLPHDTAWLGMTAAELGHHHGGRIVGFMFHDRVSFGGTLLAVAVLYVWLARGPIHDGRRWAWWTLAASATAGFLSFLAWLGYGYLDVWHGIGTLLLLPVVAAGLAGTRPRPAWPVEASWLVTAARRARTDPVAPIRLVAGTALVALASVGMIVGGLVILGVGATTVFVPQDLTFIGSDPDAIRAIDPGLVPLIAHDRAAFGGGLLATGIAALGVAGFAPPSMGRWCALALAGAFGFGAAIGVHVAVGYLDLVHLGPAFLGLGVLATGLALSAPVGLRLRGRLALTA